MGEIHFYASSNTVHVENFTSRGKASIERDVHLQTGAVLNVSVKGTLQRIHIIGGPGSGKSYAARYLSLRLGIPAYHLDVLFWDSAAQSYGVRASDEDRDAKLMAITNKAAWVIEGVYYRWLIFWSASCKNQPTPAGGIPGHSRVNPWRLS